MVYDEGRKKVNPTFFGDLACNLNGHDGIDTEVCDQRVILEVSQVRSRLRMASRTAVITQTAAITQYNMVIARTSNGTYGINLTDVGYVDNPWGVALGCTLSPSLP